MSPTNAKKLREFCGQWNDHAHQHRMLNRLVLDMDSSVTQVPPTSC